MVILVQLFNAESYITMFKLGKLILNSMKLSSSFTITWQYILCVIYVRTRSPENAPFFVLYVS